MIAKNQVKYFVQSDAASNFTLRAITKAEINRFVIITTMNRSKLFYNVPRVCVGRIINDKLK